MNVKAVEFVADTGAFSSYTFKPQLKTVGPKFGPKLGAIRQVLPTIDGSAAKKELDATGHLTLHLADGDIELLTEDLLIDTAPKDGFYTLTDNGVTVAIDTTLTAELIAEGNARELASKIQTMRKECGFQVEDKVEITLAGSEVLTALTEQVSALIAGTLTVGEPTGEFVKEWNVNGEMITIGLRKICE